jgi:hypothetical protein
MSQQLGLELKLLAESIKIKLEAGSQQFLFKPGEVVNLKEKRQNILILITKLI